MSSQWVNKYAIMRDLSLVQGCVPVDVAGTVEAGDTPPSQNFGEDTEEDYYRNWVSSNGDFAAPDLGLIKHMLEVVRNHDVPSEEEVEIKQMIQISKLNPNCPEFYPNLLAAGDKKFEPQPTQKPKTADNVTKIVKPQTTNTVTKTSPKIVKPKKQRTRNIAVESLLENMKDVDDIDVAMENKDTTNILKPKHISDNTKAADKVSGWLETHEKPIRTKKSNNILQLDLDPTSMFKKKKKTLDIVAPKPVEVKSTSPYCKYVPSDNAAQYYKKFLECSRMKEMVQENVWTKVERQMKEIDERRVAEAELFAMSLALCREEAPGILAEDPVKQKLDMVFLPCHRHALPSPCRVCELRARHTRHTQHSHTTHDNQLEHTAEEHDQTVDDSWRSQNKTDDETKNVGDEWRKEHKTFINEHVKKIEDFCKNQTKVDTDNNSSDDTSDSLEKRVENGKTNKFKNWRNRNKTIVDNPGDWRNETKLIIDTHIQSWRSKSKEKENETPEAKGPENVGTDFINTENAESWASLDDEDEVDAWKFEILGDEDDDLCNEFYEASEIVDGTFQTNSIQTWQAISDKTEDNQNETNNNHKLSEKPGNKIPGVSNIKEYDDFGVCKSNIQCKSIKCLKPQLIANKEDEKASFEFEITKSNATNTNATHTNSVKYEKDSESFQFEIRKTAGEYDKNKYAQFSSERKKQLNIGDGDDDDDEIPISCNMSLETLDILSDSDQN